MKKNHKSLQAIIITVIVGMFIPKIIELTGINIVDKTIWKIVLTCLFNVSTIIVGFLYSVHLLHGKESGGKARITIFLVFVIIILCCSSIALSFVTRIAKIVSTILCIVAVVAICLLVIRLILSVKAKKREFKTSQTYSIELQTDEVVNVKNDNKKIKQSTDKNERNKEAVDSTQKIKQQGKELKTIFELWQEFDHKTRCLTVTNSENPDLRWVKIYKPPYRNGKFYGYIKMQNARDTVSGEIYYADRPIWSLYKE